MHKFTVIDLETTGVEGKTDHIVEVGFQQCRLLDEKVPCTDHHLLLIDVSIDHLVKPPISIPPNLSACHHITDADVVDAKGMDWYGPYLNAVLEHSIVVAHNAEFEKSFLETAGVTDQLTVWICTWKCALHTWPDAPSHSNVALGYYLGFLKGRSDPFHKAHTALWDSVVTTQTLCELLKLHSVEQLIAWTKEEAVLRTCPIGKHRDQKWEDIPRDYLKWILGAADMRSDVVHAARMELERRRREGL